MSVNVKYLVAKGYVYNDPAGADVARILVGNEIVGTSIVTLMAISVIPLVRAVVTALIAMAVYPLVIAIRSLTREANDCKVLSVITHDKVVIGQINLSVIVVFYLPGV